MAQNAQRTTIYRVHGLRGLGFRMLGLPSRLLGLGCWVYSAWFKYGAEFRDFSENCSILEAQGEYSYMTMGILVWESTG